MRVSKYIYYKRKEREKRRGNVALTVRKMITKKCHTYCFPLKHAPKIQPSTSHSAHTLTVEERHFSLNQSEYCFDPCFPRRSSSSKFRAATQIGSDKSVIVGRVTLSPSC